jgi:hypothetical protein
VKVRTDTVPESGSAGKPRTRQAHAGTSPIHSVIAVSERTPAVCPDRRGRGDQGRQPVADASRVGHEIQEAGQCDRVRQREPTRQSGPVGPALWAWEKTQEQARTRQVFIRLRHSHDH